jgi:hypothetical protein
MAFNKIVFTLIIIISFAIVGSTVGTALAKLFELRQGWLWATGLGVFMTGIGSALSNYLLFR